MTASRYWASSASRIGNGSLSGPWPGPVLRIFLGSGEKKSQRKSSHEYSMPSSLAPTKLYRPIVSELAALSKRNEYFAMGL